MHNQVHQEVYILCFLPNKFFYENAYSMVLISDSNSEIVAHTGRDPGYMICLRHFFRLRFQK